MGCGLDIGFIDHLYTPLGTTLYSSLTQCPQSITVSTSHFLATDLPQLRYFNFPHSGPVVTAASA
jgi:hypothetical protein